MTTVAASTPIRPARAGVSPGVAGTLWLLKREFIRFVRQPSRIIASVGTAALIWLVLGSGFAGSFSGAPGAQSPGGSYATYLIPGMAAMIALFASIFAAISLIEDRQAGFLQSVLVSPAPRWAIVLGKLIACSILSTAQAAIVLLAGPILGLHIGFVEFGEAIAALAAISVGITGLGLAAAWYVDSTQGFHGVMNLLLMPMWLLSGAFFPLSGSATWLGWVMRINPLTWPTEALRHALHTGSGMSAIAAWGGSAAFALFGVVLPSVVMRSRVRR